MREENVVCTKTWIVDAGSSNTDYDDSVASADSDSDDSCYESDDSDDLFFPSCRIPDLDLSKNRLVPGPPPKSRKPTQFWVAKAAAKDFFRPSMKPEIPRALYFLYVPDFPPETQGEHLSAHKHCLDPWVFALQQQMSSFLLGATVDRNYRVYTSGNNEGLTANVFAVKVEMLLKPSRMPDFLFQPDPAWTKGFPGHRKGPTPLLRAHFVTGDNCCIKCKKTDHIVAQCSDRTFSRCKTIHQQPVRASVTAATFKSMSYSVLIDK